MRCEAALYVPLPCPCSGSSPEVTLLTLPPSPLLPIRTTRPPCSASSQRLALFKPPHPPPRFAASVAFGSGGGN